MNKKRIAALIGVIFLIALALATLIFALIDTPWAYDMFKICLGCVIILPVMIYVYMLIAKVLGGKGISQENEQTSDSDDAQN